MTAAPVTDMVSWDDLVGVWRELDVPEGWRAEIIEGYVSMSPPPNPAHNWIAGELNLALAPLAIAQGWHLYQTAGMAVPLRSSVLIPDLVVIPKDRCPAPGNPGPMPVKHALLVVEITSKGNANVDRTSKLWSYANAGVPLYLLVDRFSKNGPETVLYSRPEDGGYQDVEPVPFGEPVTLPEPFDLTLETTEF